MGPLQLSDQVLQNGKNGEQMTHWDMLNKSTHLNSLCSTWPSALQFGDFVPRDCSAAKGPLMS